MNVNTLNDIIGKMAATRPYFYSEADFQHYLASSLVSRSYTAYLEYPINGDHIDIILEDQGAFYPIELKYRTKAFSCTGLLGDIITLKDQNAHDLGRYEFWEDVWRIENIKNMFLPEEKIMEGYVVILTNDPAYWTVPNSRQCNTIDRQFKIHTGNCVQNVHWVNIPSKSHNNPNYVAGKANYPGLSLTKSYKVPEWIDYSQLNNDQFKFLTIQV
ncbi:MAG: hypothetical protein J5640_08720 [Bacteroidales bacterium]|nr:hypothetical protein [Bacteroidales bacterium]